VTPTLARAHGQGLPLAGRSRDFLTAASALAFIPFGVAAGIGPSALGLLLGPGWETACGLVPLLALNAALYFLCSISYAIDEVRRAFSALLVSQTALAVTVLVGVGLATRVAHSLVLVPAAMALGPLAGHALQLVRWRRAGLIEPAAMLRVHLVHAVIGGSLFLAGRMGAGYGHSPLGATFWGSAAVVPVVGFWCVMRHYVPVFTTAVERGLVSRPAFAGRTAPVSPS
jgi:O-antigen/teichoic acid export membrane protein